jgi:hypothetical protein
MLDHDIWIVATHLGIRSAKYNIAKAMSMMALLTGERSKPPYMKLPSTVENNIGIIPTAGKANPVITAYRYRSELTTILTSPHTNDWPLHVARKDQI